MRKPIRKIVRLRVDEISSVSRGANPGAVCLIRKSADAELSDIIAQVRREFPGIDDSDARMFAEARLRAARQLYKHGVSKMTNEEMFSEWWSELSAEERQEYRRLQSLIDEQNAIDERAALDQTSSTSADMVHGSYDQDPLSVNERRGYGSGARAKALDLRAIAKAHGLASIAKMICKDNDAHRITESELVYLAKLEAEGTGKSVGELLLADATLAKACQIARYGEMARQAERNVFDSNIRARAAQPNI